MSRSMEFLKATGGNDWKTLEALVSDLDRADYWKDEPEQSSVEKRRHVRKMLVTLVFQGGAPPRSKASDNPSPVRRYVFVSVMKAADSGEELVRVYKQFFNLTSEERRDILADEEANHAYRPKWATRGRGVAKAYLQGEEEAGAGALLREELTEETMQRAWPGSGPAQRRRIVLAALIQHRSSEETLRVISERCRAEGLDVEKLVNEYLRNAGVSPVVDPQEANEVAGPATEYFKVVDELEGLNFGKMCLEALMEARTSTVGEFANREGMDFKDAANLFAGEFGEHADEFQGVLEIYRRDSFGWTLDEHLRFAIERRGERG